MTLALVWAQSADRWIGRDGQMPWHLPEDLAHFRELTAGHPVIMGRRTWESLPERFRPLPGRDNIVLSGSAGTRAEGATLVPSVAEALAVVGGRDAWVIGGAAVYAAFLPLADRVELTQIDVVVDGDVAAPALGLGWQVVDRTPTEGWSTSTTGLRYRFLTLGRTHDVRPPASPLSARRRLGDGIPTQSSGPGR